MEKLDIRTAFLNAPLGEDVVVVKPPAFAVQQGMAAADELWLLHKALYGLRVAPRKWEQERDQKMSTATWTTAAGKRGW